MKISQNSLGTLQFNCLRKFSKLCWKLKENKSSKKEEASKQLGCVINLSKLCKTYMNYV